MTKKKTKKKTTEIHKRTRTIKKVRQKKVQKTPTEQRENPGFMSSFDVGNAKLLETNIDKLYDAVKAAGVIRLDKVSKKIGVPIERTREWADVLEKHNMIDIDYPVVGEPLLKLKKYATKKHKMSIEEKVKELEKNHKHSLPKLFFIPAALIGGGAIVLYDTAVKYTLIDTLVTFINQNPSVSEFIDSLSLTEIVSQNILHIFFVIYSVFILLMSFVIWFLVKHRKRK